MFNDESMPNDFTYSIMNQKFRNLGGFSHSVHACDNESLSPIRSKNEMVLHSLDDKKNTDSLKNQPNSTYPIMSTPENQDNARYSLDNRSDADIGRRPSPAMTPISYPDSPNSQSPIFRRNNRTNLDRTNAQKRRFPWQSSTNSLLNRLFSSLGLSDYRKKN